MVKRALRELGLLPRGQAGRLRREGNLRRDAGQWERAADAYRRYLHLKPEEHGIWIQYGHVLQEAARLQDATRAYRHAAQLSPSSPEAFDHLARILLRCGDEAAAIDVILEALGHGVRIDVGTLTSLAGGGPSRPGLSLTAGMTLYSVQDMIAYLHHHATLSGIQRVQAGIARHLIEQGSDQVGFLLSGPLGRVGSEQFALIGKAELAAIIDYATGDDVEISVLQGLLVRCTFSAQPVVVGSGHTMIVLGAFWALGSTPKTLWPAKRAGARIGVYIYDLIPLTHPQFCVAELTRDFCRSLLQMLEFVDFFLTISDYTRFALHDLMAAQGLVPIPMATVPLAHELTRQDTGTSWPATLADLRHAPFVAYISTVEGRKNHIYVVRVWQRLFLEGVELPDLVFVGRPGWRNEALYRLLEETHNLAGKVRIVHDLDDAELNGIYARAQFTIFTSFVEGWGLPVGESLRHGTPCVASNSSSIPEVGGAFVDYIDPYDIETGVAVVRRMVTQPQYLQGRRAEIRDGFRPRSWNEVGLTLVRHVNAFSIAPPRPSTPPRIRPGHLVLISPPSRLQDPTWYFGDVSESLVRDDFYDIEPFGAWMKGEQGTVRFRSNAEPGSALLIYLSICTCDASSSTSLKISVNGREVERRPVASLASKEDDIRDSFLRIESHAGIDGEISVGLELDGPVAEQPLSGLRRYLIGLRAVGVSETDGTSQSELLDKILRAADNSTA